MPHCDKNTLLFCSHEYTHTRPHRGDFRWMQKSEFEFTFGGLFKPWYGHPYMTRFLSTWTKEVWHGTREFHGHVCWYREDLKMRAYFGITVVKGLSRLLALFLWNCIGSFDLVILYYSGLLSKWFHKWYFPSFKHNVMPVHSMVTVTIKVKLFGMFINLSPSMYIHVSFYVR